MWVPCGILYYYLIKPLLDVDVSIVHLTLAIPAPPPGRPAARQPLSLQDDTQITLHPFTLELCQFLNYRTFHDGLCSLSSRMVSLVHEKGMCLLSLVQGASLEMSPAAACVKVLVSEVSAFQGHDARVSFVWEYSLCDSK